jgi:hypothetical protein
MHLKKYKKLEIFLKMYLIASTNREEDFPVPITVNENKYSKASKGTIRE